MSDMETPRGPQAPAHSSLGCPLCLDCYCGRTRSLPQAGGRPWGREGSLGVETPACACWGSRAGCSRACCTADRSVCYFGACSIIRRYPALGLLEEGSTARDSQSASPPLSWPGCWSPRRTRVEWASPDRRC